MITVHGPPEDYSPALLAGDAPMLPYTVYGAYKVPNDNTARIYWQDHGIPSIALRPYSVFGLGRHQGFTRKPTKATLPDAKGDDYEISFGRGMQLNLASDIARQFIVASQQNIEGAQGCNFGKAKRDSSFG